MCFNSRDKEQNSKAFDLLANLGKLDLVDNKSIETLFPMGYESMFFGNAIGVNARQEGDAGGNHRQSVVSIL